MFKREFKANMFSLILWTSILAVLFLAVFIIYPSIVASGSNFNDMMEMFPKEMLVVFNMDIFDMNTALGWIQTEGYLFWLLISALYASLLGANLLTKEENTGTIEFLYSKPISRNKIVTNKILIGILNITIVNVVTYLVCVIGLAASSNLDFKLITLYSVAVIFLSYIFFSITLFISTFFHKEKKTRGIAFGLVFGMYLLQMLGSISDKVKYLKNISLFEFVSIRYTTVNLCINWVYLLIGFILIGTSIYFTYYHYNKKELV